MIVRGKKSNTLYVLQAKLGKGEVNTVQSDSIEIWHKRLGHMSEKGLSILIKKNVILDVKGMSLKLCSYCLHGKIYRHAFHIFPPFRKKNIFNLIHTDISSMNDRTLGGVLYFVTFIDDHSEKFGFLL